MVLSSKKQVRAKHDGTCLILSLRKMKQVDHILWPVWVIKREREIPSQILKKGRVKDNGFI